MCCLLVYVKEVIFFQDNIKNHKKGLKFNGNQNLEKTKVNLRSHPQNHLLLPIDSFFSEYVWLHLR